MKPLLIILFLLTLASGSLAQDTKFDAGAHSLALAKSNLLIRDAFSTLNSIAVFGSLKRTGVGVSFRNQFDLPENAVVSAASIYHQRYFNIGVGFLRFGDEVFNYQRVSAALGNRIGNVSLALRLNRHQYAIENLGIQSLFSLDFGGTVHLGKNIILGTEVENISRSRFNLDYQLPTVMRLGFQLNLQEQLTFQAELEKDIDSPAMLRGGVEYRLVDWLAIRGGLSSRPLMATGGIGIIAGVLGVDYAFANRSTLGEIHEITLQIHLKTKEP